MLKRTMTTDIILHCASTYADMDIDVATVRDWHVHERGWDDIGYHWLIRRNGAIEKGREESAVGAHCSGHNYNSIGICLAGGLGLTGKPEDNFTEAQFESLARLIREILIRYPGCTIHGHSDYANKACPVFNVPLFIAKYLPEVNRG